MPARISRSSISGESDAGPMVATILVLWGGRDIGASFSQCSRHVAAVGSMSVVQSSRVITHDSTCHLSTLITQPTDIERSERY